MPYIKSERREEIDCSINSLITKVYNAGDINYAITFTGWESGNRPAE